LAEDTTNTLGEGPPLFGGSLSKGKRIKKPGQERRHAKKEPKRVGGFKDTGLISWSIGKGVLYLRNELMDMPQGRASKSSLYRSDTIRVKSKVKPGRIVSWK